MIYGDIAVGYTAAVPSLAKNLRAFRRRADLTQTELATRSGVKQNAISSWEKGKAVPTVRSLVRIANGLGCSVDDLLAGVDPEYDERRSSQLLHTIEPVSEFVRQAPVVEPELSPPNVELDHPGGSDGSSCASTDPREPFLALADHLHTIAAELEALTHRTALRPVAADRGGSRVVRGEVPVRPHAHRKLLPPRQAKTRAVEPKRRRRA